MEGYEDIQLVEELLLWARAQRKKTEMISIDELITNLEQIEQELLEE